MKKAVLLLIALIFTQAAFAYYAEFKSSDIETLQGTGYSQETLKIIDTARMLKQGVEKDYVPYYPREFYSDNPVLKYYQMARRYWDPGSNSPDFGFKEINYANSWFESSQSYNSKINPNDRFQRLFDKDIERLEYAGKTVKGSSGDEEKAKEIIKGEGTAEENQTETNTDPLIEDL